MLNFFIKFGIQNYYNEVFNLIISLENKEQIFEILYSLLIILNNNYCKLTFAEKKICLIKFFKRLIIIKINLLKIILLEKINNMLQILIENKNN